MYRSVYNFLYSAVVLLLEQYYENVTFSTSLKNEVCNFHNRDISTVRQCTGKKGKQHVSELHPINTISPWSMRVETLCFKAAFLEGGKDN